MLIHCRQKCPDFRLGIVQTIVYSIFEMVEGRLLPLEYATYRALPIVVHVLSVRNPDWRSPLPIIIKAREEAFSAIGAQFEQWDMRIEGMKPGRLIISDESEYSSDPKPIDSSRGVYAVSPLRYIQVPCG